MSMPQYVLLDLIGQMLKSGSLLYAVSAASTESGLNVRRGVLLCGAYVLGHALSRIYEGRALEGELQRAQRRAQSDDSLDSAVAKDWPPGAL